VSAKFRILIYISLLISTLFLLPFETYTLKKSYGEPGTHDFIQYWASARLVQAGENPYNSDAAAALQRDLGSSHDYAIMMWNPPWTLTILAPVLNLPFGVSAAIWFYLSFCLLLSSSVLLFKAEAPAVYAPILPLLAAAIFYPAWQSLVWGQLSIFLLFALSVSYFFFKREKFILSGFIASLLTVKPHLFILIWLLAIHQVVSLRNYRLLFGLFSGFLALTLPIVLIDSSLFIRWIEAIQSKELVSSVATIEWKTASLISWLRIIAISVSSYDPQWLLTVVPLLGVLVGIFWLPKQKPYEVVPFALTLSVIIAPYGWLYDFSLLLLVQVWLLSRANNLTSRLILLGIQAVVCLIGAFLLESQHQFVWYPILMLALLLGEKKVASWGQTNNR